MRNAKRFLATVTAAVLALTPATVLADTTVTTSPATGGAVGKGDVEGYIDKSVFTVILPTIASNDTTFDFILDPQDLIKDSQNAAYTGAAFADNTGLYFQTSSNSYSSKSAKVTVETKTSMPVDVTVDAKVSIASGDGVTFVDDANVAAATDEALSVYLALTDDVSTVAVAADGTASLSKQLAALPSSSFEVKYSGGVYSYGLTSTASTAAGSKYSFYMVGACNKSGDWTDVKDLNAKVELVWTISKADEAVTVNATNTEVTWSDRDSSLAFNVDLAGLGYSAITDVGLVFEGTPYACNNAWSGGTAIANYVTIEGNTVTFDPFLSQFAPSGATVYLQFDNNDASLLTLTIK